MAFTVVGRDLIRRQEDRRIYILVQTSIKGPKHVTFKLGLMPTSAANEKRHFFSAPPGDIVVN